MRIRVHGIDAAVRAGRISQVLLAQQDEWRLGHPTGVKLLLAGGDLLEATSDVHGARPPT